MTKTQKAEIVASLTAGFTDTAAVVICDYKGTTCQDLESLRAIAREKNTSVQVVKNSLATIALKATGKEGIDLNQTNIFLWSEDVISASKVAADFAKKTETFSIKSGYLDGETADVAKIEAFAKLPGREELLGMLAATWMAPVANFTIGLDALRRQKEEGA